MTLFIFYSLTAATTFLIVMAAILADCYFTGREYRPGTSVGAIFLSAMVGVVVTVGTAAGVYILTGDLSQFGPVMFGLLK